MDPELMEAICECPESDCLAKNRACVRCLGTGYVACADIREGEPRETPADQRAEIVVSLEEG